MIEIGLTIVILIAVSATLSLLMPVVTELPWGLEQPISIFMSQVMTIITIFPPLEVVWHVVIIGLTVKASLFAVEIFWKVIQLIRG